MRSPGRPHPIRAVFSDLLVELPVPRAPDFEETTKTGWRCPTMCQRQTGRHSPAWTPSYALPPHHRATITVCSATWPWNQLGWPTINIPAGLDGEGGDDESGGWVQPCRAGATLISNGVWGAGQAMAPGNENGWSREHGGWVVNSVGFAGPQQRYTLAIMNSLDEEGDYDDGIETTTKLAHLSRTVNGKPRGLVGRDMSTSDSLNSALDVICR